MLAAVVAVEGGRVQPPPRHEASATRIHHNGVWEVAKRITDHAIGVREVCCRFTYRTGAACLLRCVGIDAALPTLLPLDEASTRHSETRLFVC